MNIIKLHKFNIGKIRHHTLWVFGYPWWSFYYLNRFGWFRIFGVGFDIGISVDNNWTPGVSPITTKQQGMWQVGAVIY
jgi:hypothetical protein